MLHLVLPNIQKKIEGSSVKFSVFIHFFNYLLIIPLTAWFVGPLAIYLFIFTPARDFKY